MITKQKTRDSGFTIIEVLISLFILAMIMVGAGQLLSDSSKITRNINAQTNVQEELRAAASIMNDEIQRAYYVFPPNASEIKTNVTGTNITVNWSVFNLGSSNKKTGIHESTTFTVNSTPSGVNPQILAMISAPRDPSVPCLKEKKAAPTSTDIFDSAQGCYQFVAYYGVLRPKVTRGLVSNSTTSSELLNNDTANTSRMVLMEFRMNLIANIVGSPSTDWGEVGCENRGAAVIPASPGNPGRPAIPGTKCTTTPTTADPSSLSQTLTTSIPALTCYGFCNVASTSTLPLLADAQRFAARMKATVDWINLKAVDVTPSILADYIDESQGSGDQGFFVSMPTETYDARGVFQVRLRLKGKISVDGKITSFPAEPISVYAAPRNIAPLL